MKKLMALILLAMVTSTVTPFALLAKSSGEIQTLNKNHSKSKKSKNQGPIGPQGPKGDKGDKGNKGDKGDSGNFDAEFEGFSILDSFDSSNLERANNFSKEFYSNFPHGISINNTRHLDVLIDLIKKSDNKIQKSILKTILLVELKEAEQFCNLAIQHSDDERFGGLSDQEVAERRRELKEKWQGFLDEVIEAEEISK